MRHCWLLVLVVVILITLPVAAQERADAPAANVVKPEEETLLPLNSLSLFPAPPSQGARPAQWETAALFSPAAMFGPSAPAAGLTSSRTDQSSTSADSDKWEVISAPYLWLASIDGDAGVGRVTSAPLNVSASTILENFQFGFMGRFEARKGRWGGIFEATYVKLGASVPTTGAVIGADRVTDAEFEQTMLEAFLSYRVFDSEKTSVDLFGGARYWDMDIDLDITGPVISESLSRGERWADPVFGVRVIHFVSDRWFIPVRGDLGGFGGAGATSDFTWNLQGGVGFQASKHVALVVQYKALGVDFDNGKEGTIDFFAFDAISHGPLLGFVFRF